MENEKLTYINSRGERLELGVDSVYHCNISKDVEGISGVTSVIYSTNSMGQHGDTYVGQRIEARDIDVVGHINTRDKAQALELRRRMLKIFNPELSATLVYEYGGFKRVIDCRAYGEPKILKKEVLYEFDLQIECLNPFWREEEETKEDIASWVAAWHFPCVIEKDSTKSMIYGYRAESVIVDCYNEGDVSTGMRIRFTALGTVSNPILLNVDTEEFIQINATMKTGDVIEINTKYGSKGAKLIRDGVETDYFRYKGNDLTATNTEGNTPCIFSRDFDNVNEQEYTASIENCGNFIYVQGAADDDGSQPVTTVDGEGATGLDLVEVFCDATDIARKYQQFIKHELGVEAYIRYMDDFVILSPDKEQLRNWLARIEQFLREELKLEFNPKTTILAAKNGIDFVGYKHRATHRKVRKDSIKRIKRTIKKCESGKITKEQLQKSIQSWTGHAGHADSYNLRKKIETLAEAAIEKAA